MTYLYLQHDSFISATRLIYMCNTTYLCVQHDLFICATRFIYICNTTYLYVQHDLFMRATRLIYICNTTHLYVRHDSFICVCDSCICVCDSFICVCVLLICVCDSFICLVVAESVHALRILSRPTTRYRGTEYSLFYRALLQKRPVSLSILLTVATPYPKQRNKINNLLVPKDFLNT